VGPADAAIAACWFVTPAVVLFKYSGSASMGPKMFSTEEASLKFWKLYGATSMVS
jgi:hypothetical protein